MKKTIFSVCLMLSMVVFCNRGFAYVNNYEITRSTFNHSVISVSTSVVTLVSLPISTSYNMYSVSLWNISTSSAVYTISTSSTSAPVLTCANGPIIGSGSETAPYILTEQFEDLYMWALACGSSAISNMRRVIRGR